MFKNILIPTDGSEQSQRAVHAGVRSSRRFRRRLTGIHVIRLPPADRLRGRIRSCD